MSDKDKPEPIRETRLAPTRREPLLIKEDYEVIAHRIRNGRYPECSFTGYPYRSWTG